MIDSMLKCLSREDLLLMLKKDYGTSVVQALKVLVDDQTWELRDSVLEFMSRLLEVAPEFAMGANVPAMVFSKRSDPEAFVRSTCFRVLKVNFMDLFFIIFRNDIVVS